MTPASETVSADEYRAKSLTEQEMQRGIVQAARRLGYLAFHPTISQGNTVGYPDITIVGHGHVFVFEVKGPRGRTSEEQCSWIGAFMDAGITALIVWPEMYETALRMLQEAATP